MTETQTQGYLDAGRTKYFAALAPYFSPKGLGRIKVAYQLSKYAHRGQNRKGGLRYFEHPKTVSWILFAEVRVISWKVIVVALLHDVIEDSFVMTEETIRRQFGKDVALDIQYVSHNSFAGQANQLLSDEYFGRMHEIASWRCLIVKLADRIHNLRTIDAMPIEKQQRKLTETIRYVVPLCEVLLQRVPPRHYESAQQLVALFHTEVANLAEQLAS